MNCQQTKSVLEKILIIIIYNKIFENLISMSGNGDQVENMAENFNSLADKEAQEAARQEAEKLRRLLEEEYNRFHQSVEEKNNNNSSGQSESQ